MGEKENIIKALRQFIECALIKGDAEKSLEVVSDDVMGAGMGEQGLVFCKEDAKKILNAQKINPKAVYGISYHKTEVRFYPPSFGTANILFEISCTFNGETVNNFIVQSAAARKENGKWKLCMLLANPVEVNMDCANYYPLEFAENTIARLKSSLMLEIREMMNKSVSGGMIGTYIEKDRFPLYLINESMLNYLGYTKEEFYKKYEKNVIEIVHGNDRKGLLNLINKAVVQGGDFEAKFRVVRKDGSYLWMLEQARKTKDDYGKNVLIGIFTDITEMIILQNRLTLQAEELEAQTQELEAQNLMLLEKTKELMICQERFRIALEKSSNVIFEYDMEKNIIIHSGLSETSENLIGDGKNMGRYLIHKGEIEPEYIEGLNLAFEKVKQGNEQEECTVKVRMENGKQIWKKISLTGVSGTDGVTIRVIGMIEDVTKQKEEELYLAHKSEHDSMTGLYNKGACITRITQKLEIMKGHKGSVFMMLDIDHFKEINDSYGHPFGDKILIGVSQILRESFREDDIVGRLGGDEFCVFFSGGTSRERIEQCAKAICSKVRSLYIPEYKKPGISCSIGITVLNENKKTFDLLYKEADYALYLVKNQMRDGYKFYGDT